MPLTTATAIFGHTSEDTALLVDDYPYGFRLRTSIRYWIETTKNGDRFVSQTLNPKTGRWNKPKKSTYSEVGVMFRDEQGHIQWDGISMFSDDARIELFRSLSENFSDAQKGKLALAIGVRKASEGVTYVIREGEQTTEEKQEQARISNVLAHRATSAARNALEEL